MIHQQRTCRSRIVCRIECTAHFLAVAGGVRVRGEEGGDVTVEVADFAEDGGDEVGGIGGKGGEGEEAFGMKGEGMGGLGVHCKRPVDVCGRP